MLETPNATADAIYPLSFLPYGDDGKRKPFHILHCLAQPPCDATLRLSPGNHSCLPPRFIAKLAAQKGWLADKHGYALCPLHKPGGAARPPSDLSPKQKQAAFLAIRDRNMEAAAARHAMKRTQPVGALAKQCAKVRAATDAERADLVAIHRKVWAFLDSFEPDELVSPEQTAAHLGLSVDEWKAKRGRLVALGLITLEPDPNDPTHSIFTFEPPEAEPAATEAAKTQAAFDDGSVVKTPAWQAFNRGLREAGFSRAAADMLRSVLSFGPAVVWASRHSIAHGGGYNYWTFNDALKRAIRLGLIVQEPVQPPARRPFRLRLVDKFDPPAIQPEPMESAMPEEAATAFPPAPPKAEEPRQPTREHNRRIRDYLDSNYNEEAGRYRGDLSDEQAAQRLSVPRAWVATIRATLYGDDRNEADEQSTAEAEALATRAAALEATALDLATKAESLGKDVRQFLDRKAKP
jgi:hypothetical protein